MHQPEMLMLVVPNVLPMLSRYIATVNIALYFFDFDIDNLLIGGEKMVASTISYKDTFD